MTTPDRQREDGHQRRRKVAAALSAGLVVGVGVASTLASWNAGEYAAGEFRPSRIHPTHTVVPTATGVPALPGAPGSANDAPLPSQAPATTPPSASPAPSTDPSPTPPPEPGTFTLMGSSDGVTYADHAKASASAMVSFSERASRLSPGEGVTGAFALRLSRVGSGVGRVALSVTVTGAGDHLSYGMYTTAAFGCRMSTATTNTLIAAGTALSGTTVSVPLLMPTPATGSTEAAPVYVCIKVRASNALVPGSKHAASWLFRAEAD